MTRPIHLALTVALALGTAIAGTAPAEAKQGACPPGLAKKAVPCVPPGQVGKLGPRAHGDDDRHVWRRGDYLRNGEYVLIPRDRWDDLGLPHLGRDEGYARVGDQILRVALATLVVIEAVRILDRLID